MGVPVKVGMLMKAMPAVVPPGNGRRVGGIGEEEVKPMGTWSVKEDFKREVPVLVKVTVYSTISVGRT